MITVADVGLPSIRLPFRRDHRPAMQKAGLEAPAGQPVAGAVPPGRPGAELDSAAQQAGCQAGTLLLSLARRRCVSYECSAMTHTGSIQLRRLLC